MEVMSLRVEVGGKEVLRGVDLSVRPGELVVITGPNGSGKSTLARAIMGDERIKVKEGRILIDGRDVTDEPAEERFKAGLFLAFQSPPEFEGVKIMDFLKKVDPSITVDRAKEVAKMVGLPGDVVYRELHRGLSGGEKKRVELMQALLFSPRYAVFDEIDSGVDVESVGKIVEIIKGLARDGTGVVYITHNPLSLDLLKAYPLLRMEGGVLLENGR